MRKILVITIYTLIKFNVAFAQITDTSNNFTVSNPTLNSLYLFNEIETISAHGLADISFPVCSIPTIDASVNIDLTLAYHPYGIRFGGMGGEIGVGWSLFKGGFISRKSVPPPHSPDYEDSSTNSYKQSYSFSFLGYRGKFNIRRNNDDFIVTITENKSGELKLNVQYDPVTNVIHSFTFYDSSGNQYLFSGYKSKECANYTPPSGIRGYFAYDEFILTEIKNKNDLSLCVYNYQTLQKEIPTSYLACSLKNKILSSINIVGKGKIEFTNDTFASDPFITKLNAVKVFDFNNTLISKHDFSQMPSKLFVYNNNESLADKYEFNYKELYQNSFQGYIFGFDSFGFQNAFCGHWYGSQKVSPEVCTTGVLQKISYPTGGCKIFDYESNDYSFDETGLSLGTDFLPDGTPYESDAFFSELSHNYSYQTIFDGQINGSLILNNIPSLHGLLLEADISPYTMDGIEEDNNNLLYPKIGYFSASNLTTPVCIFGSTYYPTEDCNFTGLRTSDTNNLIPETPPFLLKVLAADPDISIPFRIRKKIPNPVLKKWDYGAGIRVKNIAIFDKEVTPIYYTTSDNTVREDNIPVKEFHYDYRMFNEPNRSSGCRLNFAIQLFFASDINMLGIDPYQPIIIYKNITVSQKPNLGKEEYTYLAPDYFLPYGTSVVENDSYISTYTYPPLLWGQVLHKKTYDSSYKIKQELTNEYYFSNLEYISINLSNPTPNGLYIINSSLLAWAKIKKQTVTDYFYNNDISHSITQEKEYIYDTVNRLPYKEIFKNSKNEIITSTFIYNSIVKNYLFPEFSSVSNSDITLSNNLINKKCSDVLLFSKQEKNGTLLSTKKYNYSLFNNAILPSTIQSSKGNNNLETKITYNSYDNKGNLTQYTLESGIPVSIIWGYNQTQPIAKIENASYSQVSSYVNNLQTLSNGTNEASLLTALDALRSNLPNAMVTTYTYIPLVGVSTITDPKADRQTFTYDTFGRLQYVKDKNGNILSENQYHYRP
ncbi:hypothetical protein [Flavobacterium croceum]|uniref:hypothetical protein n=1 Tax=Flavobacterium croceum TaxID=370975 RepID=UPI0024A9BDCE|nr:hypothetical protein [Flavobacterium croceum]